MAEQLIFDWPTGVALAAEDFFVSTANATAFAQIAAPQLWSRGKLALIGPAGAGKSHLARVFAVAQDARILMADDLRGHVPADRPCVVEDADSLPTDAEEPLFHLHNNLAAAGLPLLLTARSAPARWAIALPDLASRMQATTVAQIGDPDDALLQAVLMKHFMDRQLPVKPALIDYLAPRIERSFTAAAQIVSAIDREALATGRPVGRKLAGELLGAAGQTT